MSEKELKGGKAAKDLKLAPSKTIEKESATEIKEKAKKPEKRKQTKQEAYDPWNVLHHAHLAEKSMGMVETQNTLTFIVDVRANKTMIREAVEK